MFRQRRGWMSATTRKTSTSTREPCHSGRPASPRWEPDFGFMGTPPEARNYRVSSPRERGGLTEQYSVQLEAWQIESKRD